MINPKQTDKQQPAEQGSGEILPFKAAASLASPKTETPTPTFTWEALERQLADLAVNSKQRALVAPLVSATRKQAPFKPPEMVLREVLCIASVLMDETFHPTSEEGEMT